MRHTRQRHSRVLPGMGASMQRSQPLHAGPDAAALWALTVTEAQDRLMRQLAVQYPWTLRKRAFMLPMHFL